MRNAQEKLSSMALTTFALNGQFLRIAEQLAAPAGLTATRWQVLGAVLDEPLTLSEIARRMGITRQSVRRTSGQLVEVGMAQFIPNPSHRSADLLQPTDSGYAAVRRINPQHAAFAQRLESELSVERMAALTDALTELQIALGRLMASQSDLVRSPQQDDPRAQSHSH